MSADNYKTTRDLLEEEAADLKVVFSARGVRREDGLTAAEVRAQMGNDNETKEV